MVGDPHALSRLMLVLVACMVTACVFPRSTESPVHTFVLTTETVDREVATAVPRTTAQGVLLVGAPQAAAGFEQPRMAYLQRPSEVSYYATHFWVDAPSRMLAPLLLRALEQSGHWRVVVPMPSALRADHQLDVSGLVVQQEFLQKPSHSRVRLRAQLTDLKTQRVMGARSFDMLEPAPSEDAYGGVLAANRAV
ncbi:MAG TPA: ABC-type transport auxiliary lipoprotein family protein, partial [Nitrospira sp.]|nr:ABC-type transport auxiliary lipoprotein family protein [Nitrospira sp.]